MNKQRVQGSAKIVKKEVKVSVSKTVGDARPEIEGKTDKIEPKGQNASGSMKEAMRKK